MHLLAAQSDTARWVIKIDVAASLAELARAHRKAEMGDCRQVGSPIHYSGCHTHKKEMNCHLPQAGTLGAAFTQRLSPLLLSLSLSDPSIPLGLGNCVSDPGPARKVCPISHCFQSHPSPACGYGLSGAAGGSSLGCFVFYLVCLLACLQRVSTLYCHVLFALCVDLSPALVKKY